jgi:hypothetical protein
MLTPAFERWIDKARETYEADGAALDPLVDRTLRSRGATDQLVFAFAQVRLLERIAKALEVLAANGKGARR